MITYHMDAMELTRDEEHIADLSEPDTYDWYTGSVFSESYTMANEGGLTQRYLSMSGAKSGSLVIVDQTVVGTYQGTGAFVEVDLDPPVPAGWWPICPWGDVVVVCP